MAWWPDVEWQRMCAGDGCAMCADAHVITNSASDLVATLPSTYVRLVKNQTHAGYCVVILRHHVPELHELTPSELDAFWRDVAAVGGAISIALNPVKVHYLVMGSRAPHLHCHVYPQYPNDDPLRNVDISEGALTLDAVATAERIDLLRASLARPNR